MRKLTTVKLRRRSFKDSIQHSQRGATLVEFSIAIVLVVIFLAGTVDYGYAAIQKYILKNAIFNTLRATEYGVTRGTVTCDETSLDNFVDAWLDQSLVGHVTNEYLTPTVCDLNDTVDGVSARFMRVSLTRADTSCIFCLTTVLPFMSNISATGIFRTSCDETALPNC